MKVALIGNDTDHRRFLIHSLLSRGFDLSFCIFETQSVEPLFDTAAVWADREKLRLSSCFKIDKFDPSSVLPIYKVDNLNDGKALEILRDRPADVVIVSGARKLDENMLRQIKNKSFNIHLGNALYYRGLDSNLWALYFGDTEHLGVTLHLLDTKLDTGDVLALKPLNIPPGTPVTELRYYEMLLAVELCVDVLNRWPHVKKERQSRHGKYYSFMPAEDKNTFSDFMF